jgi:hypothetical protein
MLYEQEAYGLEAEPEVARGGENKKYIGIFFQC